MFDMRLKSLCLRTTLFLIQTLNHRHHAEFSTALQIVSEESWYCLMDVLVCHVDKPELLLIATV